MLCNHSFVYVYVCKCVCNCIAIWAQAIISIVLPALERKLDQDCNSSMPRPKKQKKRHCSQQKEQDVKQQKLSQSLPGASRDSAYSFGCGNGDSTLILARMPRMHKQLGAFAQLAYISQFCEVLHP